MGEGGEEGGGGQGDRPLWRVSPGVLHDSSS